MTLHALHGGVHAFRHLLFVTRLAPDVERILGRNDLPLRLFSMAGSAGGGVLGVLVVARHALDLLLFHVGIVRKGYGGQLSPLRA